MSRQRLGLGVAILAVWVLGGALWLWQGTSEPGEPEMNPRSASKPPAIARAPASAQSALGSGATPAAPGAARAGAEAPGADSAAQESPGGARSIKPAAPAERGQADPSPRAALQQATRGEESLEGEEEALQKKLQAHTMQSVFPCITARVQRGEDFSGQIRFKARVEAATEEEGYRVELRSMDGDELGSQDEECIWSNMEGLMLKAEDEAAFLPWLQREGAVETEYSLEMHLKGAARAEE